MVAVYDAEVAEHDAAVGLGPYAGVGVVGPVVVRHLVLGYGVAATAIGFKASYLTYLRRYESSSPFGFVYPGKAPRVKPETYNDSATACWSSSPAGAPIRISCAVSELLVPNCRVQPILPSGR